MTHHFLRGVSVLLLLVLGGFELIRAQPAPAKPDLEGMFDALVNKNPKPKLVEIPPEYLPLFSTDYDWDEERRVRELLRSLNKVPGNDTWPYLLRHTSDAQYCACFDADGSAKILTVGDLCREVVRDDLTHVLLISPPLDTLDPPGRREWTKNWRPNVSFDKEWRAKNGEKKLYELQIEMLQWLMTEAPGMATLTDEYRMNLINKVQAAIDDLRKTKRAKVHDARFTFGHGTGFDKQAADRIRKQYLQFNERK